MRQFEKKSAAFKVATRDLEDIQDDIIDIDVALIKVRAKVENPSRIKMPLPLSGKSLLLRS